MSELLANRETICAVATPHGTGAQSTIKVSGAEACSIVDQIFRPAQKGITLSQADPYTAYYGWIIDPDNNGRIDDAIVLVLRAPHSYTGEDQVEITYHGNPFISQLILEKLIDCGARLALPGEYTRRALSNGKLDLSEAEAVADVIAASNRSALRLSIAQMRGLFRNKIGELRDQIISLASLVELGLDFSEEDIEIIPNDELLSKCEKLTTEVAELAKSYTTSQVIKNGIPIAIVGATNAGKSTLLNRLLGDNKAIVSDIHGTTRDIIEDTLNIEGQTFRLIDTAGLRETNDAIEHIGIERALEKAQSAELLLWVIDPQEPTDLLEKTSHILLQHKPLSQIVPIVNKCDIAPDELLDKVHHWLTKEGYSKVLTISAREERYTSEIKEMLHQHFTNLAVDDDQVLATNIRQATALKEAGKHLQAAQENINQGLSGEIIAQDLRQATNALGSVIGEVTTDDLLHSIFSNFCIGK